MQASNSTENASASNDNSNEVKLITSLVIILSFFVISLILLGICYKTTVKLEAFAGKIRAELANEYQNALNLHLEQAVRVNTYLLKSLAPEKPLMGKSMLKSSWWKRTKSPTRNVRTSIAGQVDSKLIQLKPIPIESNSINVLITDPVRNNS
jgi:hypothetical protein